MTVATDYSRLAPTEKAALIYAQAHDAVATRLWRAALGSDDLHDSHGGSAPGAASPDFSLESLLTLMAPKRHAAPAEAIPPPLPGAFAPEAATLAASPLDALAGALGDGSAPGAGLSAGQVTGLGPNARFGQALLTAATRTGLPAAALAAIVDAEAGKAGDGSWKTTSRNPRSSAAGLGQFLGGTWQSEAERAGTWLHGIATGQGWLGSDGRVLASARSALLSLRYDATTSINATADYAVRSVAQLKQAGIAIGEDLTMVARAAYLGHHLGTADAVRFLTGGLDNSRARVLLDAQVGTAAAHQRIAHSSDAATAHRSWLIDFINRRVTPARFGA